jgi:hypothetical protein
VAKPAGFPEAHINARRQQRVVGRHHHLRSDDVGALDSKHGFGQVSCFDRSAIGDELPCDAPAT